MPRTALLLLVTTSLVLAACARRGPRDVRAREPAPSSTTSAAADAPAPSASVRAAASPRPAGVAPRVLARVTARAVATTPSQVVFGDDEDDVLRAVDKTAPGEPVVLARRAPVPGGLVADAGALEWIATPGDVVLRMPASGGAPAPIRDHGIFAGIAASGGDVFVLEAERGGGALVRITGATAAVLGSFDAVPRAVAVDADDAYVITATKLRRVPRRRGAAETLATGASFTALALTDDAVWVTDRRGASGALVRVPKHGGAPSDAVPIGVRDAPIAARGAEVFYFDDARPALRTQTRVVSEDPAFERPVAMTADDDGVFIATRRGVDALVVAVPLR